ncbi:MAG: CBS domain-containing protein [Pseudomonadota bacterium]
MKIKAILEKKGMNIFSITPDKTLGDMAEEMISRHIGSLLVLNEDGSMAGIITERDFLRNVSKAGKDWAEVIIDDVMTKNLITAELDEDIKQVMAKMSENRIRHIPVINENKVAGLLSVVDIVRALHEETSFQNEIMKRYIKDWPEDKVEG